MKTRNLITLTLIITLCSSLSIDAQNKYTCQQIAKKTCINAKKLYDKYGESNKYIQHMYEDYCNREDLYDEVTDSDFHSDWKGMYRELRDLNYAVNHMSNSGSKKSYYAIKKKYEMFEEYLE